MIRWKYVVPRLVLLTLSLVFAWLAMNPVLRWTLVRAGQAATGAKVEINSLRTRLTRSEVRLTDVSFADPDSPFRNLFEAEAATLDLENSALLRRQFVVKEGRISGLRLGNERESDGTLSAASTSPEEGRPGLVGKMGEFGQQWLENAAGKLKQELEDDLHSVRVARELTRRWPAEYDRIEQRANEIQQRGKALANQIEQIRANPLDAVEGYQRTAADLDQLMRQAMTTQQELSRLQHQIQLDRVTIQQAKQHDQQYVRDRFTIDRLDAESLTKYLLGPELGERAQGVVGWIQWARRMMPEKHRSAPNQRGIDVLLPNLRQRPALLAKRLVLDGSGSAGDEPFTFTGELTDLTTQPKLHGRPAVLNIQTKGAVQMLLRAQMDHTQDEPVDRVVIQCPHLKQPRRMLGDTDQLAVGVSQGESVLNVELTMIRDNLSGTISMRQNNVQFSPQVGSELGGELVARHLHTALANIEDLAATIELGGSMSKSSMKLRSNLGTELATGLNTVFQQTLAARQAQLLAKAHQEVDQPLRQFEQQMRQRQDEVLQKLQMGDKQIAQLKQLVVSQLGLPRNLQNKKNALLDGLMRKAGLR